ncbi:MAG: sugar transferase [Sphingopyxis sp.]
MPRIFDLFCLILALPLVLPIAAVVAIVVYFSVGWPTFFSQERGGYRNVRFRIYKFRTMTDHRDAGGVLLPDAQRLTAVGRFLRASSLDELPSLWNLLKGDIRLVGPRPFFADYIALYSDEQRRRHEVIPGITGWAQVNGRNALSWEEKFALDVWYVENRSILLDLKILWLTAVRVLTQHGISAQGEATMPRFDGTN